MADGVRECVIVYYIIPQRTKQLILEMPKILVLGGTNISYSGFQYCEILGFLSPTYRSTIAHTLVHTTVRRPTVSTCVVLTNVRSSSPSLLVLSAWPPLYLPAADQGETLRSSSRQMKHRREDKILRIPSDVTEARRQKFHSCNSNSPAQLLTAEALRQNFPSCNSNTHLRKSRSRVSVMNVQRQYPLKN